jgi:integrase
MIRFRTRTTNKENNSIFIRFKEGNKFDLESSIGIKVPKGKFSLKLQRINYIEDRNVDELNKKIRQLKTYVLDTYSTDSLEGVIINNKWLKSTINNCFKIITKDHKQNEKQFLSAFLDYFIEYSKKRLDNPNNPIKNRTIQHYQTTKNKLIDYEEQINKKHVKLIDVDMFFHEGFTEYLETVQKLNPNTIGGYLNVIKRACSKAELKGYQVNPLYKSKDFTIPSNKSLDTYLTLSEIHKIYEKKFDKEYLDNARDWLIIGVWTGFRVSDLLTLNKTNIDGDYIQKDTLKTDFPVYVPMHKHVKSILEKRKGKFPRKISDQKFNNFIKEICFEVGLLNEIKGSKMCSVKIEENGKKKTIFRKVIGKYKKYELISSHCCRRSFASNHYGKLDTLTIMKITGHKTESQFLKYIKVTPREYAERLKEYWKKIDVNEFTNS